MGDATFDIDPGCAQLLKPASFVVVTSLENPAFWNSSDVFVAAAPGVASEGLASFVKTVVPQGCCVFQTSGSEGAPKWVVLTKWAMLHSARAVCGHLQVTKADRWLLALPEWHVGGFSLWARAAVSGCEVVKMESTGSQGRSRWDAACFAEVCERGSITLASLVPAQVFDLVQAGIKCPSSVRAVVVGGGRLEPELGLRARTLGWPVLQCYGMTEAGSQVATEPVRHLTSGFDPDSLLVLPCWSVEVNAGGRLKIRGRALAAGYVSADAAGWRYEPLNGELETRDQVELVSDGHDTWLRMLGRESQTLKVLGELVVLAPLQSRLATIASAHGIKHAQLAGAPDERAGEVVVLRCEAGHEAEAEMLRLDFNKQVRPFERAVRVEPVQVTELGKMRA